MRAKGGFIILYCISCRQPREVLEKADQLYVKAKDWRICADLYHDFPDKGIILEVDFSQMTRDEILQLKSDNLTCCLENLEDNTVSFFVSNNIPFFYKYPVSNFYNVKGLIDLGVKYIRIIAPLTFCVDQLKEFNVSFRAVPNISYDSFIPRGDGICGQWIRPEDVSYYEGGISVFEFEDVNLIKERTLLHIYKEERSWPGNLNLLFSNFYVSIDNKGILENIGKKRSTCHQICQNSPVPKCRYCQTAINYSKMIKELHKKE